MPVDPANCSDEPSEALNPTPNMMSHAIGWTNEITTRDRALEVPGHLPEPDRIDVTQEAIRPFGIAIVSPVHGTLALTSRQVITSISKRRRALSHQGIKRKTKPLSSLLPRELVLAAFKARDLAWLKVHRRAVSRSICLPLV